MQSRQASNGDRKLHLETGWRGGQAHVESRLEHPPGRDGFLRVEGRRADASLTKSAHLILPETDKADHQHTRLAQIVIQMMSRRDNSIGELSDAAFRQFKDSEPPAG